MSIFDYVSISVGILIILSFILLAIKGKREISNNFKHILLLLVCSSFLSIIVLSYYYEDELNSERDRITALEMQIALEKYDSLLFTAQEKEILLDSLKKAERELDEILMRIQKQEKIVGSKTDLVENVKQIMKKTNNIIYEIENYNEIIENSTYTKSRKGLTFSGETSLFTFQPPLNTDGDYLDFIIKFHDESLIDKIAVMYIEVHEKSNDGNVTQIYEQYYKPQKGVNAFRLRNYFIRENVIASIGFFWKSDFGKSDFPRYEKVSYSRKIDTMEKPLVK